MNHPIGMYVLSMTEMWERFSYYIFSAILVLFMYEVLHFSSSFSSFLYGIIIGVTYLFQMIAGYISDTYLGNRKSIIIGGIGMFLSQLIFMYAASLYSLTANVAEHSSFIFNYVEMIFLIGIVFMIFGSGFFKVSVTSFVGLFYEDNDERLDSAYTIFYMFINIGAFLAPLLANFVVGVNNPSLYQYGFLMAAIIILIGTVMFILLKNKYMKLANGDAIGVVPISKDERMLKRRHNIDLNEKLSKIEINHMKVIFLILIVIIAFFINHEQVSTSFVIFTMNYVNNIIPFTNFEIAPELYLSLGPLILVIMGPLFIKLFSFLSKKDKEPSSITKMGIGLLIISMAYFLMLLSLDTFDSNMRINMFWLVLYNVFMIAGELLIMPIAISLISKLAPPKYTTMMMGVMFAATAIGTILAGVFASSFPVNIGDSNMFLGLIPINSIASFMSLFIVLSIVLAIIWLLFRKRIIKLSHGIE